MTEITKRQASVEISGWRAHDMVVEGTLETKMLEAQEESLMSQVEAMQQQKEFGLATVSGAGV